MSKLNNLSKSEIKDLLNVTVCYIVKNEEKYIKKSIDKVKELLNPLEILVVDTGSTDKTVEIALKSGARVEHYEWVHDYSKARNFALKMAKNDMILFLDADEIPYQADLDKIKRGIATYPQAIGRITRQNYCYASDDKKSIVTDKTERLFDRRIYKYEDAVHEQVVKRNKGKMEAYLLPLVVKHYGYLQSREKLVEKAEYYNSILFRELKKKPNDPYIYFQIGKGMRIMGKDNVAFEYFKKSLALETNPQSEYYIDLINQILILAKEQYEN